MNNEEAIKEKFGAMRDAIDRRDRIHSGTEISKFRAEAKKLRDLIAKETAWIVEELAEVNERIFVEEARGDKLVRKAKAELEEALLASEGNFPRDLVSEGFSVRYVRAHNRTSWNTAGLEGYAVADPKILRFQIFSEVDAWVKVRIEDGPKAAP